MTAPAQWQPTVARGTTIWAGGDPSPTITLPVMVAMTLKAYEQPQLVEVASQIAATVREKDPRAIVGALLAWLRAKTRFVDDPVNEQVLKSPLDMLGLVNRYGVAAGDCVDVAMLAAALAMAVGLEANFIAEAYTAHPSKMHADLTHVYTVVSASGVWYALDTQRPVGAVPATPTDRVRLSIP